MTKPRVIYWFRTDLRLHDSPALKAALDLNPEAFYPIWTWDPHYVYRARVGSNRWQFLLDCQASLSTSITALNPNSKLFLLREAPQTLLPKLFKAWSITHLVFEKDTDAYARSRDELILHLASEANVQVTIKSGRTLWDSDELVKTNGGKPTMSITQVQTAGPKVGEIPRPIPAPTSIPNPGTLTLDFEQEIPNQNPDLNSVSRNEVDKSYSQISGPNGDFAIPTTSELGLKPATSLHRGGEHLALKLLDKIISNEKYTAEFEKPKTAPTDFLPQSTTLLSPHIHFGSISTREIYWRVKDIVDNYSGKASSPPVSLIGQLQFRDMYFGAQSKLGYKFGQIMGNSHCRFIPWHLPSKIHPDTGLITGEYEINNPEAEIWFQRWKFGRTGFPFIDALMRQLRLEGWIHHLGRHAVACFLTRGGCYVSWERGLEVFEEWLVDHEGACNSGNWMWLSCSAFYAQFFRCYSPVAFGRKWDPEGAFVRRYVPELKDLDKKVIYEPWKAGKKDLEKAGVRIEGDGTGVWEGKEGVYPERMFDFDVRREVCIQGMKKAYKVGLYGNDPKVLDGTWRDLFDEGDEGVGEGKSLKGSMVNGNGSEDQIGHDEEIVDEDESGAKGKGGENKGGDKKGKGVSKRKREGGPPGPMERFVTRSKK